MPINSIHDVKNYIFQESSKGEKEKFESILWSIDNRIKTILDSSKTPKFNIEDTWGFWFYNRHDYDHACRVTINMFALIELIGRNLPVMDKIVAYISSLGHDLAMGEVESELIKRYCKGIGIAEKWRENHPTIGVFHIKEILEQWRGYDADFNRGITEIQDIISKHSGAINPNNRSDNRSDNTEYLMALLRIADLMDAAKDRLPQEDIIGEIIALASTIGEPFLASINHYLRRFITDKVTVEKTDNFPTIKITVQNILDAYVNTPSGEFGRENRILVKDAFSEMLKEFSQELGRPDNWDNIRSNVNLDLGDSSGISNSILKRYGIQITWAIDLVGPQQPWDPILNGWINRAEVTRKMFDSRRFHPLEIEKMHNEPYSLVFDPLDFTRFPDILTKTKDQNEIINVSFVIGSGKYKTADHVSYGTDALYIPEITSSLKDWAARENLHIDSCLDIDIFGTEKLRNNNLFVIGSGKVNYITMELEKRFGDNLKVKFYGLGNGSIRSDLGDVLYDQEKRGEAMGILCLIQNPWAVDVGNKRIIVLVAGARPIGSIAAMHMLVDYIKEPSIRENNKHSPEHTPIPAHIVKGKAIGYPKYKERVNEFDEDAGRTPTYIGNIKGYDKIE